LLLSALCSLNSAHTGVALQAVLQVPSVLALLWFTDCQKAGSIEWDAAATWGGVLSSSTAIFFYIYSASALACQALGFWLPPQRYMQLAAGVNLLAVLLFLWSLWVPQVMTAAAVARSRRNKCFRHWFSQHACHPCVCL
jgi:hypothetical protein